jgi:hypothetical protein
LHHVEYPVYTLGWYAMPTMTNSPFNRLLASFMLLTFSVSVGCSTVRTIPVSQESYQVDDAQTLTDINASAASKTPQVTLTLSDPTPVEAAVIEHQRVRLYTNGDVQFIRVNHLDFPYIEGTTKQRTEHAAYKPTQIRINLGEVDRIEVDDIVAVNLTVDPDSVTWHAEAGGLQRVSWSQVESIRFVSRGPGVLDGLKTGALVGLVVGLPAGPLAVAGAVAWGVVLGTAIGFGVGHKDIYRFEQFNDE